RAAMLLRANALAKGCSGAHIGTVELLLDCLNRGVLPYVPSRGSVGASGDLAPLAHLALPLVGEGEAWHNGERVPAADALAAAGLEPVRVEVNAATDNPLVLVDDGILVSNGNFHGQPVAFALDALAMAVAELANISERRIERLVNPSLSGGLPAFLTSDGGLNSGFMIPQY